MAKKILIIGFGSAGRRHAFILGKFKQVKEIRIISKVKNIKYKKIEFTSESIKSYNPDYIIISNETYKHYTTLLKVNMFVKNKVILVEKPLFHKFYSKILKKNNKIYVAYNLRFNPLVQKLKFFLKKKNFSYISATCFSDATKWRKNISFDNSYSSSIKKGGGVALDLSHEIDLIKYLVGDFKILFSLSKKISNLKSKVDDILLINAKKKQSLIDIKLNYYTSFKFREILVIGTNYYALLNFNKNFLILKINNHFKKISIKDSKNKSYENMHLTILKNKHPKIFCTYRDGLNINKFISKIKK